MSRLLPDEVRARVAALIETRPTSFAEVSRVLGKSDGYLSRYVHSKVPYDLAAADRGRLARFIGVDADTLQPPPRRPRHGRR